MQIRHTAKVDSIINTESSTNDENQIVLKINESLNLLRETLCDLFKDSKLIFF